MPLFEHIAKFASLEDNFLERQSLPVRVRSPIQSPTFPPQAFLEKEIHNNEAHPFVDQNASSQTLTRVKLTGDLFDSSENLLQNDEPTVDEVEVTLQERAERERLKNKQRHRRKFRELDDVEKGVSPVKSPRSHQIDKERQKWLRQQCQLEPVVDQDFQPGVFPSPAFRRIQEARQQRWRRKKGPVTDEPMDGEEATSKIDEPPFEEKKLGRNMRAMPSKSSLGDRSEKIHNPQLALEHHLAKLNTQHQLHKAMLTQRTRAVEKPTMKTQQAWGTGNGDVDTSKQGLPTCQSVQREQEQGLQETALSDRDVYMQSDGGSCDGRLASVGRPMSEPGAELVGSHADVTRGDDGQNGGSEKRKKKKRYLRERGSVSSEKKQHEDVANVSEEFKKLQPSD